MQEWLDYFASIGVRYDSGLSDLELNEIENRFGFVFPPDLRELLACGLPVGKRYPNWRDDSEGKLQDILNWPYEGMCFDIEHNTFWPPSWGARPSDLEKAFAIASAYLDEAPKLIPIFAHRYIPDRPNQAGNPIFSVYQTDIVVYGTDLHDYLRVEFGNLPKRATDERRIEFWSDLVDYVNGFTADL